jgi:hypothetical protein
MGNMNILPPELVRHRLCHGGGRTLAHTDVVRGVDQVAQFSGNPSEFAAPIRSRRLLTALA